MNIKRVKDSPIEPVSDLAKGDYFEIGNYLHRVVETQGDKFDNIKAYCYSKNEIVELLHMAKVKLVKVHKAEIVYSLK